MKLNKFQNVVAKAISILCLVCMLMTSVQPLQGYALSSASSPSQGRQVSPEKQEGADILSPSIMAMQTEETPTRISPRPELKPSVILEISSNLAKAFDFSKAGDGDWFRVLVSLQHPSDLKRLQEWQIQVLKEFDGYAYVLVSKAQLEKLSRLGFRPSEVNSVDYLVQVYNTLKRTNPITLQDLVSSPNLLLSLSNVDTDNDGLTDTEESWWCTDPQDNNSDFPLDPTTSNPSDGDEVNNILRGIRAYGPPFALWPQFTPHNPNGNCPDGDFDAVPDYAEEFVIGTSNLRESSDLDKFDDGQELFGVTYCPGTNGPCGYGILPRAEDAAFVSAILPAWVKEPGNSPFVAAFPEPEVTILPSSTVITQKTVITNTKGTTIGTEKTYGTSQTTGTSSSRSDTTTWNSWQEASITQALPKASTVSQSLSQSRNLDIGKEVTDLALFIAGCYPAGGWQKLILKNQPLARPLQLTGCARYIQDHLFVITDYFSPPVVYSDGFDDTDAPVDRLQDGIRQCTISQYSSNKNTQDSTIQCDASGSIIPGSSDSYNWQGAILNSGDRITGSNGINYVHSADKVVANNVIRLLAPAFTPTETFTRGESYGGAKTVTHTEYEEQTISESSTNQYSDNWSTATAVDSSHAADLRFTYNIVNNGTEYAREVTSLTFNIYIDNNPNPAYTYVAVGTTGQIAKVENLFPGDSLTYTSNPIALTLDEMRAIDEGAPIRIVMEDISFGQDQVFYLDALNGSVTLAMEDGYDDLDETVDTYLIPVWDPSDTVQDVAKRYFPVVEDADGNLLAVFTPESTSNIPESCKQDTAIAPPSNTMVYCKHALTGTSWWNFYLSDGLDYNGEFQGTLAAPNTTMLVRIVTDSDLDGYNDRNELKLGTDKENPAEHPSPNLIAAYTKSCTGNDCTLRMAFQNLGNYDAYGVEAVLYSPDGLATITNNTIGGSGRVPAGTKIVVGPSDTFQYTITAEAAEPVIMVSYNDPQGNHRFILPTGSYPSGALISDLEADISGLNGRMLADPGVDIASTGQGQASFLINSPHPITITNGKLFVEYIDSQGNVAHEDTYAQNFASGPTVVPVAVDLNTYPEDEYILLAFFTDSQGNIIDSSARPLASFGVDPSPEVNVTVSNWRVGISAATIEIPDPWDFGIVQPGATLHGTLNIANTGLGDLRYSLIGFDQNLTLGMGSSAGTLPPSTSNTVNITIDTASMSAGPFDKTLTLRTNDPSHGTLSIHITGILSSPAGSTASAYAVSPYRPWDQFVYVPGPHSQNDIVTFTHTLADDPTRMFPLYLYSEDGTTLKGVGEYGVDFSGQTAPFGVFGTGVDSDLTVANGEIKYTDNTRSALTSTANSGQTNLILSNASGFSAGQEVLVIQIQGTGAGLYEFKTIASISSNTLTLNNNLTNTYSAGGTSKAQVLRVMQYHDVTVQSGGALTAHAWDGNTGGIIAFKASGQLVVNGIIDMTGKGYRGGAGSHRCAGQAWSGESYSGIGTSCSVTGCKVLPNNGGGGNGGDYAGGTAGGSGAGYGTQGNSAVQGTNMSGYSYGISDLSMVFLGSGGGGGYEDNAACNGTGGGGGGGGGIILTKARSITIQGSVVSNGSAGVGVPINPGAGGGGGAGGSILMASKDIIINGNVTATGGQFGVGSYSGANGGSGAVGRIRVEYTTLIGATNPTASTQQVNYYNMTSQTGPFTIFGTGVDNDLIITSGQTVYTDNVRSALSATASNGQANISVSTSTGCAIEQEVLVIQMQGTGVGSYEFARVSGVNGNMLMLSHGLSYTYTVSGNSKAQVLVIPNYRSVTIQGGGILTAHAWDGNTGGTMVFRVSDALVVQASGIIDLKGLGYRQSYAKGFGTSLSAESFDHGLVDQGYDCPTRISGDGGYGRDNQAGGGAGYANVGTTGQGGGCGGEGGNSYGIADLSLIFPGSGGGASSWFDGGSGGGILVLYAKQTTVNGTIRADGNPGQTATSDRCSLNDCNPDGGGGGAGGSIKLVSKDLTIDGGAITSIGGNGGAGYGSGSWVGGNGSVGRIYIEYGTFTGATNPVANTQQVNFYSLTGSITNNLYIPEAVGGNGIRYQLRYGQRGLNTSGGNQTFSVHLPNRQYSSTALNVLIERVIGSGSTFDFCLDLGNDGICDYNANSQSFNGPVRLDSTNLAPVLNTYIRSLGSSAEVLTIPIRVNISTPADVFIFNLSTSLDADTDLVPANLTITPPNGNPASNIPEGSQVTLSAAVTNNGSHKAENFTVGFYNGNPATDGTLIGSTFIQSLEGGVTSSPQSVTWDTTGLLKEQTIYVKADASSAVAEASETNNTTSATAIIKKKADLVITELSLPSTREGETGIANITVQNHGEADVAGAVVKLYLGANTTGIFLGSATLDVPQGQSIPGQISYNISTAGPHSIFALVDPDNLVLEAEENNNTRTTSTLTGWDTLTVDAGGDNDILYDASANSGYGRLTDGTASTICGTSPAQSYRQAGSAESLDYQFDNLLPGRFYHLDLTFAICGGDRYLKLRTENHPITELSDDPLHPIVDREIHVTSQTQTVSILLDPADYADGSVKLSILRSSGLSGPMVNLIQLSEVRYCHLDSGPSEQAWSAGNQCGYDSSLPSDGFNGWGTATYQTVRFSENGHLAYKFTGLHPAKNYNIRLTYYEGDTLGRQEQLLFDTPLAQTIGLSSTPRSLLLTIPPATYADGTVILNINEATGKSAVISDVILEQDTGGDTISTPPTATPTVTYTATPTLPPTPVVPTVALSSFSAAWTSNHVALSWSTIMEINNAAFKIFRSTDTLTWTEIASVNSERPCGNYTGTLPVNYSYMDIAVSSGETYYYRLQFSGEGCGGSSIMATQIASAVPGPGPFGKSSPTDTATNQPLDLTIQWGASIDAISYEYCYDTTDDNDCVSWVNNDSSTSVNLRGLESETTYYWHVRSINAQGTTYSDGSEIAYWSFSTVSNTTTNFTKVSPQNGSQGQPASLTLTWEAIAGASSYEYCYDTTNDDVCSPWVDNGSATVAVLSNLTDGATYYWQVRIVDTDISIYANNGTWWSFTILSNSPIFIDVPNSYWARAFIERLYLAGITGGCSISPIMYCPEASVTRAQMAVFLLRGEHGASYTPPIATGTVFGDIPLGHWAGPWIEQLATEGITGGCGNGNYCPDLPVTRDQMAVFLLRAKHGAIYTPPTPTGVFADVPSNHWAAAWIEQLAAENITGGCSTSPMMYCPANIVNRAQMAVFLVRVFNLP